MKVNEIYSASLNSDNTVQTLSILHVPLLEQGAFAFLLKPSVIFPSIREIFCVNQTKN